MFLIDAAKSYGMDKKIEGFSPQTLSAYNLKAKLLINYFGNIKMIDITTKASKSYLAESSNDLMPPDLVSPY